MNPHVDLRVVVLVFLPLVYDQASIAPSCWRCGDRRHLFLLLHSPQKQQMLLYPPPRRRRGPSAVSVCACVHHGRWSTTPSSTSTWRRLPPTSSTLAKLPTLFDVQYRYASMLQPLRPIVRRSKWGNSMRAMFTGMIPFCTVGAWSSHWFVYVEGSVVLVAT